MAESWTPPANGTPCWIQILATDVLRARKFYQNAFGWKFRDSTTTMDGREEDPTEIVHFSLGPTSPGGGITKVKPEDFMRTRGKSSPIIHLMVDDLDEAMKKVVAAGGKAASDVLPEGTRALMQSYEDTEGNFGGLYMLKKG